MHLGNRILDQNDQSPISSIFFTLTQNPNLRQRILTSAMSYICPSITLIKRRGIKILNPHSNLSPCTLNWKQRKKKFQAVG